MLSRVLEDQTLRIGGKCLEAPVGVAPMAGMTDSAFRRLVKRQGGCGLVVSEMVASAEVVRATPSARWRPHL